MSAVPRKTVALVGLMPHKLDYSVLPGLTPEKIKAGLEADVKAINEQDLDCKLYYVDPTDFASC